MIRRIPFPLRRPALRGDRGRRRGRRCALDARRDRGAAPALDARSSRRRPIPRNRVADDPRAAALGQRLFFDPRLSCERARVVRHLSPAGPRVPGRDRAGLRRRHHEPAHDAARGDGAGPFLFWDGRKDSPVGAGPRAAGEPGRARRHPRPLRARHRRALPRRVRGAVRAAAGSLAACPAPPGPSRTPRRARPGAALAIRSATRSRASSSTSGKAIAAFERRLEPAPSRFDRYVDALARRAAPATAS